MSSSSSRRGFGRFVVHEVVVCGLVVREVGRLLIDGERALRRVESSTPPLTRGAAVAYQRLSIAGRRKGRVAKRKAGKPSWDAAITIRKGLDALDFAVANRADVESRLSAGVLDGLAVDLTGIGAKIPAVLQKKLAVGRATNSERVSAAQTKKLLMKIRRALANAPPGSVDTKAAGLGTRVDDRINRTVIAAANTLLAHAAAAPEALRAAGIVDADVERLRAGVADLSGKDSAQATAVRTAKAAQRDRDATLARIEQAVRSVSSAGDLAYDDDPREALARALVPEGTSKKGASRKARPGADA